MLEKSQGKLLQRTSKCVVDEKEKLNTLRRAQDGKRKMEGGQAAGSV